MTAVRPTHWPMSPFPVVDDCLWIGGMPLTQLAARVGRTPFYAYDRRLLDQRAMLLRGALPAAIELHYAIKANPMPAVVQHMADLMDGLDVASLGELKVALDTGMDPARISFAGPGKRPPELAAAIAAGITINLESTGELEIAARLGREQGRKPRVAVRVNPDFELKASGMKMGGGPKPFGVDAEQTPTLLRRIGELELDFQGLHIFPARRTCARRPSSRPTTAPSNWRCGWRRTRRGRFDYSTSAVVSASPTSPATRHWTCHPSPPIWNAGCQG